MQVVHLQRRNGHTRPESIATIQLLQVRVVAINIGSDLTYFLFLYHSLYVCLLGTPGQPTSTLSS